MAKTQNRFQNISKRQLDRQIDSEVERVGTFSVTDTAQSYHHRCLLYAYIYIYIGAAREVCARKDLLYSPPRAPFSLLWFQQQLSVEYSAVPPPSFYATSWRTHIHTHTCISCMYTHTFYSCVAILGNNQVTADYYAVYNIIYNTHAAELRWKSSVYCIITFQ